MKTGCVLKLYCVDESNCGEGVRGHTAILELHIRTACCATLQAASHFEEEEIATL